ncbi:MAG TPA: DUF503 domain-containing protein [Actinomycetota bacterium]|nr:DUF503 domain-containing protein [Actinomycetota bacterium]
MFIGIGRYELFIPASGSLKDKRQVLRSVINVVQKKFNVAIAEVEHQELWQRAALGVSCVASTSGHCVEVLDEVERTIVKMAVPSAEVVDRTTWIRSLEDL